MEIKHTRVYTLRVAYQRRQIFRLLFVKKIPFMLLSVTKIAEQEAQRRRQQSLALIGLADADSVDTVDSDVATTGAAAAAEPIGAAFDPDWLLGTNTFLPWHSRQIRRTWVPRVVGRVSNSGSSPDAFEPSAGWRPYGKRMTVSSGQMIAQWNNEPRLAFIDGWGSGNNKLFGTYLVSHHRSDNLVGYVACRKIVPSSDFSDNPNGVSDVIFEELERNVHWVPAAVGALNLSGSELVIFMHFNDSGSYRTEQVSASTIDRWQQKIVAQRSAATPGASDADALALVSSDDSQRAQRLYWQVVLAVKNAAKSDEKFAKLTQAVPQLKTLWSENSVLPSDDPSIYQPDYRANDQQ